jgi:hypothetical protein
MVRSLSSVTRVAALLLTGSAAAVQIVRAAHAGPLWRDEAGALAIAQLPTLGEMLRRFPHEAFPLAFPLTLRGWLSIGGDSDGSLRIFGAAVAMLVIGALWVNARAAGTLPLASLALFALSPLGLLTAAVRGYGLASAAVVLAIAAHARLVDRIDRRRLFAAGAASIFAAHVALHDAALLLAIGLAAAAVVFRRGGWRPAAAIVGVNALAALSLLIYLGPLTAARRWDRAQVIDLTWTQITANLASAIGSPAVVALYAIAAAGGVVTAVLALRAQLSPVRDRTLFYCLSLAGMLIAFGVWLQILSYTPRFWYYVPLLAACAACLDGLSSFGTPRMRAALAVSAVCAALWLLPQAWRTARVRSTNIDLVAAELARAAKPNDLIVVNPWFFGISFARYYRGTAPWTTYPPLDDHRMHRYDLVMTYMRHPEQVGPVIDVIEGRLRAGGAVWLAGFYEPPAKGTGPMVVTAAPHPAFGWAEAPYLYSWSQHLAAMLAERAVPRREEIPLNAPTSGFETVPLREFRLR